jgi:pimeloyl-ACP methyl ester carboxylesterase
VILPSPEPPPSGKESHLNLNIRLAKKNLSLHGYDTAIDVQKASAKPIAKFGQITTLDDKIFHQENGSTGYWKPLTFLRDFGVGIYFIEPYSADKVPILFVHGANGTPIGWKKIVAQIDRTRYQPWFYYYPSGFRLGDISRALNIILTRLHDTYQFNALYITAHSMGGLVSRSYIMKNEFENHRNYVKLFVSISTPWNGHNTAAKGAKQAPVAIPSWHDMAPESEFIRTIYKRELPAGVKFYLFFSFRGNCSLFMKNNDGTVELESELDYRAQKDAHRIFGFNEDHDSILSSQKVIGQYNQILESNEK